MTVSFRIDRISVLATKDCNIFGIYLISVESSHAIFDRLSVLAAAMLKIGIYHSRSSVRYDKQDKLSSHCGGHCS